MVLVENRKSEETLMEIGTSINAILFELGILTTLLILKLIFLELQNRASL